MNIVTLPNHRLAQLNKSVEKINKKLTSIGRPVVTLTALDTFVKKVQVNDRTTDMLFIKARIDGEDAAFRIDGDIHFAGTINQRNGLVQYRRVIGEYEKYLLSYDKDSLRCDHCEVNRQRNKYFVFFDGEKKKPVIVGSTCVKDYFGWDAEKMLDIQTSLADSIAIVNDVQKGFDIRFAMYPIAYLVGLVDVATDGFKYWRRGYSAQDMREFIAENNVTYELADTAFIRKYWADKFGGRAVNELGSFEANIARILEAGYSNWDSLGVAGYAIYEAKKAELTTRKEAPIKTIAGFQEPNKDGRVVLTGIEVKKHANYFTQYGESSLVIMQDSAGNIYKTFTSGRFGGVALRAFESGEKIDVVGTFDKFDTYNGKKNMILKRCK